MILQALARYYQRLIEKQNEAESEGIAPYGYSPEKVSYEILLAPNGQVMQVNDIRIFSGKKSLPRAVAVPQKPAGGTSNISPCIFWGKTSYVLGISAKSRRPEKEHVAFKELHRSALADESDDGLRALLAFLEGWSPEQFRPPLFPPALLDPKIEANLVFRLDGELRYLHERPAARAVRARIMQGQQEEQSQVSVGTCLVTGLELPLARLHPMPLS
jgi:CRISPR-associated protein Csd1